jgi:large subunit ribosomal protein L7Ae
MTLPATTGYHATEAAAGGSRRRGSASPRAGVIIMPVYVDFDVPADLQDDALDTLEVARDTGTVKKGTNETTKAVERGNADIVYIAEDVQPEEIVMHLPELADERDIPFVFVGEQDDLGHSAGLEVGSAAAAVTDAGEAGDEIEDIAEKIGELRG